MSESVKMVDSVFPEKPITNWQLCDILRKTADLIQKLPNAVLGRVEYAENEAVNQLASKLVESNKTIKELISTAEKGELEICNALDESYTRTKKAWDAHRERMKAFREIDPVSLPYNTKELIEVAERWGHLPEEKWARVIELAKALKQD